MRSALDARAGSAAVLDTSVVIASDVSPLPGELAVSAVTVAEQHFGVLVAAEPAARAERLRRPSVVQRRSRALPVDDTVAAGCGRLAAAVVAVGRRPRPRAIDLPIAAAAHADGARLCTRNPAGLVGADELVEVVAA